MKVDSSYEFDQADLVDKDVVSSTLVRQLLHDSRCSVLGRVVLANVRHMVYAVIASVVKDFEYNFVAKQAW